MSNFTRSILYSTTVLAAGLVAIFAIYNNITATGSMDATAAADIAPAAGGSSDLGINFGEDELAAENSEAGQDNVASDEAVQETAEALSTISTASGEGEEPAQSENTEAELKAVADEAGKAVAATEDALDAAADATVEATAEVTEEAAEAVEETAESVEESAEDAQ